MTSLTQPVDEALPHLAHMRHSTLNLATSRDTAQVRRNLFHMQQQHSPSLSPDSPSQDSSEYSQAHTSRSSLVQHLIDSSGLEHRESPVKLSGRSSVSSAVLQPVSSTPPSAGGNRQHLTPTSSQSIAAPGIGCGYSTQQHQHGRGSCTDIYHEPSFHQPLPHVARQRSSELLDRHDNVFLPSHMPSENSLSVSAHGGGTFRTSSLAMWRPMTSASHHSQSTYDSAYDSVRNSPIPPGRLYAATQGCDTGVQPLVVGGRDIDRRYKGVACSPPGNVQLMSARRVLSHERLPLHLSTSKKLSDNDSALGGSVSDCALSPLPASPVDRHITVDWQVSTQGAPHGSLTLQAIAPVPSSFPSFPSLPVPSSFLSLLISPPHHV